MHSVNFIFQPKYSTFYVGLVHDAGFDSETFRGDIFFFQPKYSTFPNAATNCNDVLVAEFYKRGYTINMK